MILVESVRGPLHQVIFHDTPFQRTGALWGQQQRLPELAQWSDVTFIQWKALTTAEQRKGLRYIYHPVVTNKETLNTMAFMMRLHFPDEECVGRAPLGFEGRKTFSPGMEGWEALLAVPNARGAAWLFIQHREELGRKKVKGVSVWEERARGYYNPSLLIEFEEAE